MHVPVAVLQVQPRDQLLRRLQTGAEVRVHGGQKLAERPARTVIDGPSLVGERIRRANPGSFPGDRQVLIEVDQDGASRIAGGVHVDVLRNALQRLESGGLHRCGEGTADDLEHHHARGV